jgi:sulfopropanediol 3-dehydrogenase
MSKSYAIGLQDYERRELAERVAQLVDSVRRRGDEALREYVRREHGAAPSEWRLEPAEVRSCASRVSPARLAELRRAARAAARFGEAQRSAISDVELDLGDGVRRGLLHVPLAAAALVVPPGSERCLDAVFAGIATAHAAGVGWIAACIPGDREIPGWRALVAAVELAGAYEIYTLTGACAVAALAFGTESVPRVDAVVGPAEPGVSEAKRQLFGERGIDLGPAGADLLVIADDTADPTVLAADLLCAVTAGPQARATLVATDRMLGAQVAGEIEFAVRASPGGEAMEAAWRRGGSICAAGSRELACELANRYAPQRVAIVAADPRWFVARMACPGSVQIGDATVPTGEPLVHPHTGARSTRELDGLWIGHFLRRVPLYDRVDLDGDGTLGDDGVHGRDRPVELHAIAAPFS